MMPQMFQVLRCYKCSVFQVHQAKKSNKWECKLCGEKQSVKRHHGIGTAKDCRMHVQKLNGIRGEIDEHSENTQNDSDDEIEPVAVSEKPPKKSKWSNYVDDVENNENKSEEVMHLGNAEVVLEIPKKKRKLKNNTFKVPRNDVGNEDVILQVPRERYECEEMLQNLNEKSNAPKQNKFNRDNYCKTPNDNNSLSLEMAIDNKDSFKVRTRTSHVQNMPKLDTQKSRPSLLIPSKVNKHSRWAEYVDSKEDNEECVSKSHNICDFYKNPQSLFSLCDDKDLDDVLDI